MGDYLQLESLIYVNGETNRRDTPYRFASGFLSCLKEAKSIKEENQESDIYVLLKGLGFEGKILIG